MIWLVFALLLILAAVLFATTIASSRLAQHEYLRGFSNGLSEAEQHYRVAERYNANFAANRAAMDAAMRGDAAELDRLSDVAMNALHDAHRIEDERPRSMERIAEE